MPVDLKGKSAVVTGAGRGIGRGIALKLAEYGAHVAVHYNSSATNAEETVRLIKEAGGTAFAIQADLTKAVLGQQMVENAIAELGGLDILVNNAGISTEEFFFDVTEEIWDLTVNVNLKSAYFCAQTAAGQMKEQGRGKIIFIGSIHGLLTAPSFGPYAASKGAINMITKQLALELAPLKINVNCVAPGVIEVERYHEQFPWYDRDEFGPAIPWGRVGFPEDIAHLVAFLSSDEADFITGQVIYADGGQVAKLGLFRQDLEDSGS